MELNGLVLVRERSIKLFGGELSLVYDPLALRVSEMRQLPWLDFVARVVRSWDLTIDGKLVPLDADGLREACEAQPVSSVVGEIGAAIYADLTTFPKAILSAPRVVETTPTTQTTASSAAS